MVERSVNQQIGGGSNPSPSLHFIPLTFQQATKLIVEKHYKHARAPISWAWGIEKDGEILGVLTVGKPVSWSTCAGLVGEKRNQIGGRQYDVFELNRLWVDDRLPHNSESCFLAWCLRLLKKIRPGIILVSYADTAQRNGEGLQHIGYVYQATNWLYTGMSIPFKDKILHGYSDCRSVPLEKRGDPDPKKGGRRPWPGAVLKERTRKHRYVWFANPEDRALLRWSVLPYPKREFAAGVPEGNTPHHHPGL